MQRDRLEGAVVVARRRRQRGGDQVVRFLRGVERVYLIVDPHAHVTRRGSTRVDEAAYADELELRQQEHAHVLDLSGGVTGRHGIVEQRAVEGFLRRVTRLVLGRVDLEPERRGRRRVDADVEVFLRRVQPERALLIPERSVINGSRGHQRAGVVQDGTGEVVARVLGVEDGRVAASSRGDAVVRRVAAHVVREQSRARDAGRRDRDAVARVIADAVGRHRDVVAGGQQDAIATVVGDVVAHEHRVGDACSVDPMARVVVELAAGDQAG